MENKLCQYCGKKLSSRRRSDARYCPTSRCRVGGYRQRVNRGTSSTNIYTAQAHQELTRGGRIIERWQSEGLPVEEDAHCQARANAEAYDIMERRCAERRRKARSEQHSALHPIGITETIVGPYERLILPRDARCVGLALIPAECGGGAVLVTATRPPFRFR